MSDSLNSESDFAARLLALRFRPGLMGGLSESRGMQMLPGTLPGGLPYDLALPPQSRIVGSVIWPDRLSVVLHAPSSAADTLEMLQDRLVAAGWVFTSFGGDIGGFPDINSASRTQLYLTHSAAGARLSLELFALVDGSSRLELTVVSEPQRDEGTTGELLAAPGDARTSVAFPSFTPPPDVVQQQTGGGSGPGSRSVGASLYSDLPADVVHQHYAGQLAGDGWQEAGGSETAESAWSRWWRDDEGLRRDALFTVIRLPDLHTHWVQLQARWEPPPKDPDGWVPFSMDLNLRRAQ